MRWNRWSEHFVIQPARNRQHRVANALTFETAQWHAMDQQIVRIFFLIRWNRGLARHAVSTRGHQQANQFLRGPMSLGSIPGCEPVQKLRMGGRLAELSEVVRRGNN